MRSFKHNKPCFLITLLNETEMNLSCFKSHSINCSQNVIKEFKRVDCDENSGNSDNYFLESNNDYVKFYDDPCFENVLIEKSFDSSREGKINDHIENMFGDTYNLPLLFDCNATPRNILLCRENVS